MNRIDQKIANEIIIIEGESYTFAELVGIGADLNYEFKSQAGRFAYISALSAKAEALYNESKTNTEITYSDLELDYRKTLLEEGVKVTEGAIRAYVQTDERYVAVVAAENSALYNWKLLKSMEIALRERGQMLISLGANMRQEQGMIDLHINEAKAKMRELRG